MKAVILSFSLTGNTEYVGHQIGKALEHHQHTVKYFNIVPVIRTMNLVIRKREESHVPEPTGTEIEYIVLVIIATICPPGVIELVQ